MGVITLSLSFPITCYQFAYSCACVPIAVRACVHIAVRACVHIAVRACVHIAVCACVHIAVCACVHIAVRTCVRASADSVCFCVCEHSHTGVYVCPCVRTQTL